MTITLQIPIIHCTHQTVVTDLERGEVFCQECGIVKDEQIEDSGHNTFLFDKAKSHSTSVAWDMGTLISQRNSDFKGDVLSIASKNQFNRLKLWDRRSKYHTSRQRTTTKMLSVLYGIKEKLGLSDAIGKRISYLYVDASKKNLVAGRNSTDVLGAATYCACRESGVHRSLKAIAQTLNTKEKSLKRCYRMLISKLDIRPEPPGPELLLSNICSKLKIDEKTKRYSLQIINMARKRQIVAGFKPASVCSAAVWIACLQNNLNTSQAKIARAAGISTPSLRNYSKILYSKLGFGDVQ